MIATIVSKIFKLLILLYNQLAIHEIFNFLDDESGRLISDRGMYILSNPELLKEVMIDHENTIREQNNI